MKNISPELMKAIGLTVIDALWQGALLMTLVLVFVTLFKKVSPRIKYRLVVLALLLMPVWSVVSFDKHYQPSAENSNITGAFEAPAVQNSPLIKGIQKLEELKITEDTSVSETAVSWVQTNANLAAIIWLVGAVVFAIRLFGGLVYVRMIRSSSKPFSNDLWTGELSRITQALGINKNVQLKISARISSPIVMGYLRPIIVFPIGLLQGLPTDQVEAIMVHELAHIRRSDYLVNLILSALQVVYFFHPAYWWLFKQAEQEREYHCDQMAVDLLDNKLTLVKALTSVQEMQLPGLVPAVGFAGNKNQLLNRIVRIAQNKPSTNWVSGLVSLVLIAMAFGFISWQSAGRAETAEVHNSVLKVEQPNVSEQRIQITDTVKKEVRIPFVLDTMATDFFKNINEGISKETLKKVGPFKLKMGYFLDTIPKTKLRRNLEYSRSIYHSLISKWEEIEGVQMSEDTRTEIKKLDDSPRTDTLSLIRSYTKASQSILLDINRIVTNQLKESDHENEGSESELERLQYELEQNQRKMDQGLLNFDLNGLEEVQENMASLEQQLLELNQEQLSELEEEAFLELQEIIQNSSTKLNRRMEIMGKYSPKAMEFASKRKQEAFDLGVADPIERSMIEEGLEIIRFDVNEEQERSGLYDFDFSDKNLENDLLILDGVELKANGIDKLNKINVKDLGVVSILEGEAARSLYPESMKGRERVVHVMTRTYANSPKGRAFVSAAEYEARSVSTGRRGTYYYPDAYAVLINGEIRQDLTSSRLFDKYGDRYTSNLNVGRKMAVALFGANFVGTHQGLFLPVIDGKNSSIDDFYTRLHELKEKLSRQTNPDDELLSSIDYFMSRKATQDEALSKLNEYSSKEGELLIVMNSYIRKDLSISDLTKMDITDLQLITGNEAKSLYGNQLGEKSGVLKVESSIGAAIEYSNVKDPRELEENQNALALPPFQSGIVAFDQVLLNQLIKDKKHKEGEELSVHLEVDKMLINYETQPKRVLRKYLKLYEETTGVQFNKSISYSFSK